MILRLIVQPANLFTDFVEAFLSLSQQLHLHGLQGCNVYFSEASATRAMISCTKLTQEP